jgi:uncharacterized protein
VSPVLPDTEVTIGDQVPRSFTPGDTGTGYVVGIAKRGPVDAPVLITSLGQYLTMFGERVAYGALYDTLDVAFRDGLGHAYVQRVVGPEAKAASDKIEDGEAETLVIAAASPGQWGNDLDWKVAAGGTEGTFRITVLYDGTVVEVSPDLANNTEAVAWGSTSSYVRLTDKAGGNPAVSEGSLEGGDDDHEEVDAEVIEEALELLTPDLGPGQVAAPGYTTEAVHKAVIEHCVTHTRTPVLDLEDTEKAADLLEDMGALRALPGGRHAGAFGPWDVCPGVTLGTTRTVAPCGKMLGLIAAADRQEGHSNVAAANLKGKSSYALEPSQTYTNDERAELNEAGGNISIMDEGAVTNMGFRTLANPVTNRTWVNLAGARLMMDLAFGAKKVLKRKQSANLDAQGETRSSAEGLILAEVITPRFEKRAIYGETPEDACKVTVTQETNPSDGSVGKLTGALAAKPSPFAERIEFEVINVPITEAL